MKLEINMIVSDAIKAGDHYKKILNANITSQTNEAAGMNETKLILAETKVRVLDENKDLGMFAPQQGNPVSVGINLYVENIETFVANAEKEGCEIISPIQSFPEIPAKNAVFSDKFNHVWIVNQQY